ncbi:serine/threonine-protein phosphatase 6 regulatory subunit 2-like [Tetranychus urticae]|uniref:serine/threonine-protein phosphatase 6 regulatory subunit 2-like n=1 Tax=Tetranychus urticae TaxID=32264 RepID=UPI000D651265|nr:serine/threonine-protein phosphatase 6 regulatory subunit 2-like [Tetranychus urticae]
MSTLVSITLETILDQEDILHECKLGNKLLIDYLCQPDILMKLVTLVTSDPPDDAYELMKEIDINMLTWPVRFSEDIHSRRGDFVSSLVAHVGTSAVMDLLFKSLSCSDSPEISSAYLNFYHKQGLVEKLIALFKADVDPAAQSNAAQLLCDIIRFSREHQTCNQENAGPNSLLDDIESTDTITNLLTNMFETRTESCLVNGIQVIQALLEYRRYRANLPPKHNGKKVSYPMFSVNETALPDLMTPLDIERLTKSVRQVHAAIVPRLGDFHSLLTNPPEKSPVRTTIGLIEKPFGATRVEVVHLIRALLSSNNPTINRKLTTLKTISIQQFSTHSS